MRFYILVLLSMTFAACEPQPPGAGTENHPCRTGFQANWACNDGLRCVDNTCVQCGKEGEICCGSLDEHCNSSHLACQGGNGGYDGELGLCTADCGLVGKPCCDTGYPCPGGGECVDGMCGALPAGDPCLGGSELHVMYFINAECDAIEKVFATNTLAEAEQCRQAYVDAAGANEEVCPLGQVPELYSVCLQGEPDMPYQLWSCSTAQLQNCQTYHSQDGTWTPGDC